MTLLEPDLSDVPVAAIETSGGAGCSGRDTGCFGANLELEFSNPKPDQTLSNLHENEHRLSEHYSKAIPKRSMEKDQGICGNFRSREEASFG